MTSSYATETVWNAGFDGTGVCGDGRSLSVGENGWVPEHLFLLGAEASFMKTLLTLASEAGVDVLGFVSKARLHEAVAPAGLPVVSLTACVAVTSVAAARRLQEIAARAERASPIGRVLGDRLHVTLDVEPESRA